MSVTKEALTNGHQTKRRKLSHDSHDENGDARKAHLRANGDASDISDDDAVYSSNDGTDTEQQHQANRQGVRTRRTNSSVHSKAVALPTGSSSTTMLLQAQGLASEVRPDHVLKMKKLRPVTDKIVQTIKAISQTEPMSLAQAQSFAKKSLDLKIPWGEKPAPDVRYSFSFSTPSDVLICGSLTYGICPSGNGKLVITPEMPSEIFQDKDYLNHRALQKRAFYLACIASALQEALSSDHELRYCLKDDNEFVPIIQVLSPSKGIGHQQAVWEIDPSLPSTLGPIVKMTPDHNCVRKEDLVTKKGPEAPSSSPFYNSTLRSLASARSVNQVLELATQKADHFRDACLLAAIWLQQRGFTSAQAQGGFGIEEWSLICALLLESGGHQGRPLFSPRYSAVQLFKAVLQVLSGRDMYDPFIVRGTSKIGQAKQPTFYDAATGINVLFKMTRWSYASLKQQASMSLASANSKKLNGFEPTFIAKVSSMILQYDESYELDVRDTPITSVSQLDRLYDVLKLGLGDRVSLIDMRYGSSMPWKVTSSARSKTIQYVNVGITVNADNTGRLVDHGPSVEEQDESKQFRDFWGEKAELRRFKDGRISESLVWSADKPVTQQVVQYLCAKHFKLQHISIQTSSVLQDFRLASRLSAIEAFTAINTKFQSLSSALHHLDTSQVPLPIRSVSVASEHLRSASLTLPLEPGTAQPVDVVVQFDSSGRWPDELRAIQYTKIAFLTRIGDSLKQTDRTIDTRMGLENAATSSLGIRNTSYLDVIYPAPSAPLPPSIFRLRIYHEREIHLLQQPLLAKDTLTPALRETYQSALHAQKQIQASTAHTTAIRTLITAFPPLSATIRLLKHFIASHHLTCHIAPEIVEVIAAQVFLNPAPWSVPGTATAAFARCLHLLARWDWSIEPLIVDLSLSQDMTIETRKELETRFSAWRQMDPNMNSVAWFVGTNIDTTGVVWTQGIGGHDPNPPRVIAGRTTALASAALELIKAKDEAENRIMTKSDWNGVFASPLDDFDFVLHLKAQKTGKARGSAKFKNLELAHTLDVDTSGIEIVTEYVKDLTRCFGSVAIFFHGGGGKARGEHVVGGLWRPHVKGKDAKAWKIRLGYSTVPVPMPNGEDEDEAMCLVNMDAMLAEMGMLGEDIVEKITTKDE